MLAVEPFHPERRDEQKTRLASGRPPAFREHLSPRGRFQAPAFDIETPPWRKIKDGAGRVHTCLMHQGSQTIASGYTLGKNEKKGLAR